MHRRAKFVLLAVALGAYSATAGAQSTSLTDVATAANFNALELAAARANQDTFNQLAGPCGDSLGGACSAGDLAVFQRTRELVQTANELLGQGPTRFSLSLDSRGLGFALRWTAAEEVSAQGASSTRFAASQLSALATRVAALRWGVSGLRTARNDDSPQDESSGLGWSGFTSARGGAASADEQSEYNRWGPFLNDSFGYGSKDPTDLEDAFDFDGQEVTAGVDYRFTPSRVAGVLLGYSKKRLDFDSTLSIVDGGMRSDGVSLIGFGVLESDKAYASLSVGYQRLTHDLKRRISYPSFNPLVPSVDSTATSSSDSNTILAMADAGYTWRLGAFSVEPNLQVQYTHTKIDGFSENSVSNLVPSSLDPFSMNVGEQTIKLVDIAPALKLQYVLTPPFGVLVPYFVGRFHAEASNSARAIASRYADALDLVAAAPDANFNVSTDEPDKQYWTLAAGATLVLPHGWQGFLQFLSVEGLTNYSDRVITGGIRYEF
jgi:outer membrane autotransporter protein